jgi:peptide deformylase
MKSITEPNAVLREKCNPFPFDGSWPEAKLGRTLMLMLDAMYLANGIGLAAPQVGLNARVVIVDPVGERHQARILFNPEIWWTSEDTNADVEGCLSVPGKHGLVERHNRVKVTYYNRTGLRQELDTEDDHLLARVIQHEIDHLDGVLFTDKLVL